MTERTLSLRPGWQPALVSVAVATITVAVIVDAAPDDLEWIVNVGIIMGLSTFGVGLLLGSERAVGVASLPVLASALQSVDPPDGSALGRSLIIGCLWYVAIELAWASIESRDDTRRTAAVGRLRRQEVASVVIISIVLGFVATELADRAPTRTLLVRGAVLLLLLTALAATVRHLRLTSGDQSDETHPARN